MASAVVGVVGGSGGSGASTFAAALACASGSGFLIDVDPVGGGVDVLLGIESTPGARWSGLRLAGGRLDPVAFHEGLPCWRGVSVLAADTAPDAEGVRQASEAAAVLGPVVFDLPRAPGEVRDCAVSLCDLVTVVVLGAVTGIAAARTVIASLPGVSVGAVLRRGSVSRRDAEELLGVPVLGCLPELMRGGDAVPASLVRVGAGVLSGLLADGA